MKWAIGLTTIDTKDRERFDRVIDSTVPGFLYIAMKVVLVLRANEGSGKKIKNENKNKKQEIQDVHMDYEFENLQFIRKLVRVTLNWRITCSSTVVLGIFHLWLTYILSLGSRNTFSITMTALRGCNSQACRGFAPVARTMAWEGDTQQRTCSVQQMRPSRERNQWSLLPSQAVSRETGFALPVYEVKGNSQWVCLESSHIIHTVYNLKCTVDREISQVKIFAT